MPRQELPISGVEAVAERRRRRPKRPRRLAARPASTASQRVGWVQYAHVGHWPVSRPGAIPHIVLQQGRQQVAMAFYTDAAHRQQRCVGLIRRAPPLRLPRRYPRTPPSSTVPGTYFTVTSGSCTVDPSSPNCILSGGWPSNYWSGQACTITPTTLAIGAPLTATSFNTESCCD